MIGIYFTFIKFYPYLLYCNIRGGTSFNNLSQLLILQKKVVRIIAHFFAHTNRLFVELAVLKLPDLQRYMISLYMFKHRDRFGAAYENLMSLRILIAFSLYFKD